MTKLEQKLDKYYIALTGSSMMDEKNPMIKKVFVNQAKKVAIVSIKAQIRMLEILSDRLITNTKVNTVLSRSILAFLDQIKQIETYEAS